MSEETGKLQVSVFPGRRPPWGIKEIVAVLVLVLLVSFTYALLVRGLSVPPGGKLLLLFTGGLLQAAGFTGLVLLSVRMHHAPPAAVGLTRFSWRDLIYSGVLGGLLILVAVTTLMLLLASLRHQAPPPQPLTEWLVKGRDPGSLLLAFLLVGVLAPVSEEIYFRGFVYPALRWRVGIVPAVLISAGFFGALHFDPVRFFPLMLGGAGLAMICERTGSLYPSIAAHSTWNTTMLLVLWLAGPVVS